MRVLLHDFACVDALPCHMQTSLSECEVVVRSISKRWLVQAGCSCWVAIRCMVATCSTVHCYMQYSSLPYAVHFTATCHTIYCHMQCIHCHMQYTSLPHAVQFTAACNTFTAGTAAGHSSCCRIQCTALLAPSHATARGL